MFKGVTMKIQTKNISPLLIPTILALLLLIGFMSEVKASDKKHQLVIQVSTDDVRTQNFL